jgi:hypothetical protein
VVTAQPATWQLMRMRVKKIFKKLKGLCRKRYSWFELEYNLIFYLKIASVLKKNGKDLQKKYLWFEMEYNITFS